MAAGGEERHERNHDLSHASAQERRDPLRVLLWWIAVILAVGIPVQAFLASYGLFEGEPGFVDAHRILGMTLVLLIAVQVAIVAVVMRRRRATRGELIGAFVVLVVSIAQMMLGFARRDDAGMAAWHIPLGVLLMGGSVANLSRRRAGETQTPSVEERTLTGSAKHPRSFHGGEYLVCSRRVEETRARPSVSEQPQRACRFSLLQDSARLLPYIPEPQPR